MSMSIAALLRDARAQLTTSLHISPDVAALEAQVLLGAALAKPRAYLLAHGDASVDTATTQRFQELLSGRLRGEPIAYLLATREFFGLAFHITPAVLIPRPETELLVEAALEGIAQHAALKVLDLGTGSGVIAISLALARPHIQVTALDYSPAALAVARENAERLSANNVAFIMSDWLSAVETRDFDLIVSNPPYIALDDNHLAQGDLRFEPQSALVAGVAGLDALRKIAQSAPAYLRPGGRLLVEHGWDQGEAVRNLLRQAGLSELHTRRDLADLERVSGGRKAIPG